MDVVLDRPVGGELQLSDFYQLNGWSGGRGALGGHRTRLLKADSSPCPLPPLPYPPAVLSEEQQGLPLMPHICLSCPTASGASLFALSPFALFSLHPASHKTPDPHPPPALPLFPLPNAASTTTTPPSRMVMFSEITVR